MVVIMICCMDIVLISVSVGRELGYFVGSFGGTGDDIVGRCVCLLLGGIVTAFEIDAMQFNDSSYVSCKA